MRAVGAIVGLAMTCFAGASGAQAPVPPEPIPPVPMAPAEDVHGVFNRNYGEAAAVSADPRTCTECRPLSGVFGVNWETHFGYRLSVDSNFEHDLIPILDDQSRAQFAQAFSQENLAKAAAARQGIRCECSGWVLEHNGMTYFRIAKARLFNG